MSLAESLSYIIFWIYVLIRKCRNKCYIQSIVNKEHKNKLINKNIRNPFKVMLYSALDFIATLSGMTGLLFVSSTIYEFFRYLGFFFLVFLMKIFFGTKFYKHTKVGILLCTCGIVLIIISTIFFDQSNYLNWTCKQS